ncbi:MAG: hypothetical protein IIA08_04635, partial [Proteobacteria bacterium]|nr:hypothetical protein [Pseudomonadota bacterium]
GSEVYGFINIAALIQWGIEEQKKQLEANPMMAAAAPKAEDVLEALGIATVQGAAFGFGWDGEGWVSKAFLHATGEKRGILRLLADNDARGLVDAIREIDEQFPDYSRLLEDLARDLQRIAVYQIVGTCDSDDDLSEQEFAELAAAMSGADVQLLYQVAIMGRRDLHLAPDPRSGVEMTLLRMLAFKPGIDELTGAASSVSGVKPATKTAHKPNTSAAVRKVVQAHTPPDAAAQSQTWSDPDWGQLVMQMELTGAVRLLASNCAYLRRKQNTVCLALDPRSESLLTKARMLKLAEHLSKYFDERLTVDIAIAAELEETPVQEDARVADEELEAARRTLEADPNVQSLKDMFGAELKTDTIEIIAGDSE